MEGVVVVEMGTVRGWVEFPSWVGRLFMVTLPAEIQVSASLREQIPVEEINLFKLIEPY